MNIVDSTGSITNSSDINFSLCHIWMNYDVYVTTPVVNGIVDEYDGFHSIVHLTSSINRQGGDLVRL